MSPVLSFPGTHFSQIFCNKMQFQLTAYSRSGMSNGGIAVQLNTAIEKRPDLIIFNTTSFDRIELPVKRNPVKISKSDYYSFMFDYRNYSVEDLLYTQSTGLSSHYPWVNINPKLLSMSLNDLLSHQIYDSRKDYHWNHNSMVNLDKIEYWDEKLDAVKQYFDLLYDERQKKMNDSLMMYGIIHKVHLSGIPYIWAHDSLSPDNTIGFPWLDPKNNLRNIIGDLLGKERPKDFKDPGYHTTFETQEEVAQILIEHYKNNFM